MVVGWIPSYPISEVENKRIVLADVRSIPLILKRVVEHAKTATPHQPRSDFIGQAKTRGEIGPLCLQQSLAVPICFFQGNAIGRKEIDQPPASDSGAGRARRVG